MIRAYATIDHDKDGGYTLYITGHETVSSSKVPALVCAAVCQIIRSMLHSLEWLARNHPRHITFVHIDHTKGAVTATRARSKIKL
jgi:uncharacterized protein YsxB (DUF464 family)